MRDIEFTNETIRFLDKVLVGESCWEWQATVSPYGYGKFGVKDSRWRMVPAHRFSYELFVGPIPEGLHLDHLCRNRVCVRPNHLEPVTCKENIHRGIGHGHETHCPKGHPYDEANTYWRTDGRHGRHCRRCSYEMVTRRLAVDRVAINARRRARYNARKRGEPLPDLRLSVNRKAP